MQIVRASGRLDVERKETDQKMFWIDAFLFLEQYVKYVFKY